MILRKFLCLLLVLFSLSGKSQSPDSVISCTYSAFFTDLIGRSNKIQVLQSVSNPITNPQFYRLKNHGQQIIKIDKKLYIYFSGGGCLYQLQKSTDSLIYFKRIDVSDNYNYNLESFVFTNRDSIFNIGGYGFWKSNGTLRKFNFTDKEWDVEPVNKEVFLPIPSFKSWFNPVTQKLYTPFQLIINSGITTSESQENIIKESFSLSLVTKKWEKLGGTNNRFFDLLQNTTWSIPTNTGNLFTVENNIYWVDYESNRIKAYSNSTFSQTLLRLNSSYLKYFDNNKIYFLNTQNWKYDSLTINPNNFIDAKFPIWENQNPNLYIIGIGASLLFLIIFIWYTFKRRSRTKASSINISKLSFTETEMALLRLLISQSKQDKTVSISDINYVLGLKDKNIGLQKKLRSDTINLINEKFAISKESNVVLIQNVRSESDKRYFEYFVKKEMIDEIEMIVAV